MTENRETRVIATHWGPDPGRRDLRGREEERITVLMIYRKVFLIERCFHFKDLFTQAFYKSWESTSCPDKRSSPIMCCYIYSLKSLNYKN